MEEVKDVTEVKEAKTVKPKTTKAKTIRTRKPKVKAEEPQTLEVKEEVKAEVSEQTVKDTDKGIVAVGPTLYDVVPSETKTYILYTKGYNPNDINFDKVYEMGAEVGSMIVVKEWKVYFGKPSKYVPVALYMVKVGGIELIEEAKPVK